MAIKRYKIGVVKGESKPYWCPSEVGEWVKFDDHEKHELEEMKNLVMQVSTSTLKLIEAEARIKELEDKLEKAVGTIADLQGNQFPLEQKLARAEDKLYQIKEIWIGSDGVKGVPKYAQEAYALHLCKKMYTVAASYFKEEK